MTPEIERLLGAYATRTLSPREEELLMKAALEDQEIFEALGHEQALRDLLQDPEAKRELMAALERRPSRWSELVAWMRNPVALAVAGAAAAVLLTFSTVRYVASWNDPLRVAQTNAPAQPEVLLEKSAPATPAAVEPSAAPKGRAAAEPRANAPAQPEVLLEKSAPATPAAVEPSAAPKGQAAAEPRAKPASELPAKKQRVDLPKEKEDLKTEARPEAVTATAAQPINEPPPGAAPMPPPAPLASAAAPGAAPPGTAEKDQFYGRFRSAQGASAARGARPGAAGVSLRDEAKMAPPAAGTLGLRAVFMQNGAPVELGKALDHSSDAQLTFEPTGNGFLYAFVRDAGGWKLAWEAQAVAGQSYAPPSAALQWKTAGEITVVLSRRPVPRARLSYTDSEFEAAFPRSREESTGSVQGSLSAVDNRTSADAMVVLRLEIGK